MGILDTIKEAVKIARHIDNMPLIKQMLDLQTEAMDMSEQLRQKDECIAKLKKALELKGKMVFHNFAYFLTDDKENKIDGPFCTKCFDVDQIQCRLVDANRGFVQCQKCRLPFRPHEYLFRMVSPGKKTT